MARQQTSADSIYIKVGSTFIIHRQDHNTTNTFQLNQFFEKLIFDLVPQVDLFSPRSIAPTFRRRLAQWEQDRTRLNTNEAHAPFIEELSDASRKNKHHRSDCVLCGKEVNVRCTTCGAYLCAKGKYVEGIYEETCWIKFQAIPC